jgi:hypothetical protein
LSISILLDVGLRGPLWVLHSWQSLVWTSCSMLVHIRHFLLFLVCLVKVISWVLGSLPLGLKFCPLSTLLLLIRLFLLLHLFLLVLFLSFVLLVLSVLVRLSVDVPSLIPLLLAWCHLHSVWGHSPKSLSIKSLRNRGLFLSPWATLWKNIFFHVMVSRILKWLAISC